MHQTSLKKKILGINLAVLLSALSVFFFVNFSQLHDLTNDFSALNMLRSRDVMRAHEANSSASIIQIRSFYESKLKERGLSLAKKDAAALEPMIADNALSSVGQFLQKAFESDPTIVLATYFAQIGDEIFALQYISKAYPKGLEQPITYDRQKRGWTSHTKSGTKVFIDDPEVLQLVGLTAPQAKFDQSNTVFDTLMPMPRKDGERRRGFLRYTLSAQEMNQAIDQEKAKLVGQLKQLEEGNQEALRQAQIVSEERERKTIWVSILAALLLAVAGYFASALLSRRLSGPLAVLTQIAESMASGSYRQTIELRTDDEIGILAQAFQKMSDAIERRDASLADINQNLEHKIEERTREVQQANAALNSVINSMPSALILVRGGKEAQLWNDEAGRLSRVPFATEGVPIHQALSQFVELEEIINAVTTTNQAKRIERIALQTGEAVDYYDIMGYPISSASAGKDMVLRIDRITERVHIEASMIQNEKLASLGRLVASIAHEINNPIGAIGSGARNIKTQLDYLGERILTLNTDFPPEHLALLFQLRKAMSQSKALFGSEERKLRRDLKSRLKAMSVAQADKVGDILVNSGYYGDLEPYRRVLQGPMAEEGVKFAFALASLDRNSSNINLAVTRASKIVYALKSYSFASVDEKKIETDIAESIELVLTLYESQIAQGITVLRDYTKCPKIRCFPDELNQVWTNIIHNAIAAMHQAGTLKIGVAQVQDQLVVMFTDSGPGIPDAIKDKIFLPFFSTKRQGEGSGLGLSITKKIIEKHNGTIKLTSRPGETTFEIRLPMVA